MIIMTKIYIVRHCEALGNVMRIFQGTTDLDISENGAKQLEYLKKRFEDIHLDEIYTSPLIRTQKTAKAVKGDKPIEIQVDNGLIELNGGVVEGKPFKESFEAYPELADAWDNHPHDFYPENGEAMADAYDRIWNTVLNIAKKNKGKNIAITTHGGVTRCLICRLLFGDKTQLKNTAWSDNTAVSLIEFDNDFNPSVVFYNDSSHLPEHLIPRRNRISSFISGDSK